LEEHRDGEVSGTIRLLLVVGAFVMGARVALPQTPVHGHYPPGQSGIRGAVTPDPGNAYTNFSRFFSNLEAHDAHGNATQSLDELRYANISMFTWTTDRELFGMRYGALLGIPFSTGNLQPSGDDTDASFGLGDVLLTPLSLYGKSARFDYQAQLTVWSASGRFAPGATDNRGTGFWSLVYSLGGVFYPGGNRRAWSLSAIARIEQNFTQEGTGIRPGDDIVIDWGVGRIVDAWGRALDLGVSGFAAWQISSQTGGAAGTDTSRYRYFGIGPEASLPLSTKVILRIRAQWELGARNVVEGNNLWLILNLPL
jgi:hypothetical protein